MEFVKSGEVRKVVKISRATLLLWARNGKIEYMDIPSGGRVYNLKKFLAEYTDIDPNELEDNTPRRKVCYVRVSTHGQKTELANQEKFLKERYPDHIFVKDIGSGINFKRRGLLRIMKWGIQGELEELVITHKDRLARMAYDLIENIFTTYSNTNIIIEDEEPHSPEEEVVKDVIQIMTVFSAKVHGLRSYTKKLKEEHKTPKLTN